VGPSPFDKREPLKIEENKKVEVTPKFNLPEIKTVEIEETLRPSDTSLDRVANQNQPKLEEKMPTQPQPQIRSQNQFQPQIRQEIKTESVLFKKPEVVVVQNPLVSTKIEEIKNENKKPVFIKTEEENVPQPPQLNKNPQPVFEETKKADDPNKMDYDKLFGDGIV